MGHTPVNKWVHVIFRRRVHNNYQRSDIIPLLGNPPSREKPKGDYPTVVKQDSGDEVLVVQAFAYGKYLGFLQVEFDDAGKVTSWTGQPILLDNSVEQGEGC